jgi:hypothetical protein
MSQKRMHYIRFAKITITSIIRRFAQAIPFPVSDEEEEVKILRRLNKLIHPLWLTGRRCWYILVVL